MGRKRLKCKHCKALHRNRSTHCFKCGKHHTLTFPCPPLLANKCVKINRSKTQNVVNKNRTCSSDKTTDCEVRATPRIKAGQIIFIDDRLLRIKEGTRFRLRSEEEVKDSFGLKRKQWFYGCAKSVSAVSQDLYQSSHFAVPLIIASTEHMFEYEIDLEFRDSTRKKVTYPSTDVQLLCPYPNYPNTIMALTTHGIKIAYEKIPHKICVGDLVDCRINLKRKFYRGRVAGIYGKTCCVVFPNDECESEIPLDEKYIICVESGSQEIDWLIGLDLIEDEECIGKIKQVNVVENGCALSFDLQAIQSSSKKIVTRTYAEITHNLFLPLLASYSKEKEFNAESSSLVKNNNMALNEQDDDISSQILICSEEIQFTQNSIDNNGSRKKIMDNELENDNIIKSDESNISFMEENILKSLLVSRIQNSSLVTREKNIKNMTPTHASLINTLFRAFYSDPFNGYEMFDHLVQVKIITPKKKYSSIILQESSGPKWNDVLCSEYAMRCSEKVGMKQQNMKWFDFERFFLTSFEVVSNSSSALFVTKTYFALELFNLVLQQRINCKLSCRSFFGSDGVYNALKCLSHCCNRFWIKCVNILLNIGCPSKFPHSNVNARRCVELFGAICSKLAVMFCIDENLPLTHERPLSIIRDSLLEGLSENAQVFSQSNLKELKLLFILSLDVIHQSNLSKMISVASELERSSML